MVAEIIINTTAKELNKTFDYIVPKGMKLKVGANVLVPFGKRTTNGYVVALKENSELATREIIEIYDNYLDENKIKLAELMAKRYFCNVSDCVKLMLPPGEVKRRTKTKEKAYEPDKEKELTDEQKVAFNKINETIQNRKIHKNKKQNAIKTIITMILNFFQYSHKLI